MVLSMLPFENVGFDKSSLSSSSLGEEVLSLIVFQQDRLVLTLNRVFPSSVSGFKVS